MKIALCGSHGKMGSVFLQTFMQEYEIVEINTEGICLNDVIDRVDAVVDFTNGRSAFVHGIIALTHDKPIIIGSTGMSEKQKETLKKVADGRNVCCLLSSNFSTGMQWLQSHIQELENSFSTIKIYEEHHTGKKDMPSGTALTLARLLHVDTKNIHALRSPSNDVKHTLVLENAYETLRIEHIIKDRHAYMRKLSQYLSILCEIKGYRELP